VPSRSEPGKRGRFRRIAEPGCQGDTGYIEGRDVAIEYRFVRSPNDRLRDLADDLVRQRVAVITTPGGTAATLAAKAATAMIPIVFGVPGDPVSSGLVKSLNRPGGNLTGFTAMNGELGGKQLGLLHELLPRATRFALLVNPNDPTAESSITDLRAAASAIGGQIDVLYATTSRDILSILVRADEVIE